MVDRRTDIWAFGCVLYEMLTGRAAFSGATISDVIASVLEREPDWTALPPELSASLRALLHGCIEKGRRERVADISTALFLLREPTGNSSTGPQPSQVQRPSRAWWWIAALSAAALIAAAAAIGTWLPLGRHQSAAPVVRLAITTSGPTSLEPSGVDRNVAITPDGSRVIYRGNNNRLLVRALDQLEPTVLSGLGQPIGLFTFPDGHWVGFFDGVDFLKKVPITGGLPVTLCAIQGVPAGATWGDDGTVVFATNAPDIGLQRVPASGGEATILTRPDHERGEADHLWPEFLPGNRAVLFTIMPVGWAIENAQIAVLDLKSGTSKVLLRGGSHPHYVSTGHLVYRVGGTLRAVAFDVGRLEVAGTPAPVLDGVAPMLEIIAVSDVALAATGTLAYVPGAANGDRTVVAVNRQGRASPLPSLPLDSWRDIRISPDGTKLALANVRGIWTYDLLRGIMSRLTTNPDIQKAPLWTLDGQRVIFRSGRAGYPELFWTRADGSGGDERLLTRAKDLLDLTPDALSADGRQALFTEIKPDHSCGIGQISLAHPSETRVLVPNVSCNWWPAVSPRGGWMAYESGLSGRPEIYVERYSELGGRQQISADGGEFPTWSRDGRELFFSSLDNRQVLAVAVQSGTTLTALRPHTLFEFPINGSFAARPYDVGPDGTFYMIRREQASQLIVVQNWLEELKRLVPRR